jgi:hypothetical protein
VLLKNDLKQVLMQEFDLSPNTRETKKLRIIGCGRSGTRYSASLFQGLGLDITHELDQPVEKSAGRDGISSWFLAVDDPNPPNGPSDIGIDFQYTIHQVRHPLLVIASFAQFILKEGTRSPEFIGKHIPGLKEDLDTNELSLKQKLILQAARYWYEWNLLAEKKATETVQLEELDKHLARICDILEIPFDPGIMDQISRKTNEREWYIQEAPWVLTWEDLYQLDPVLTDRIRNLSVKYGYDK